MEFFKSVGIKISEAQLISLLSLEDLELYSNNLLLIGKPEVEKVKTGGIWGEFTLTRQLIAGGVRFALQECPNALTWTVTTGLAPDPGIVVIHLTINRKEKDPEFVEELEDFLQDLCEGIKNIFTTKRQVMNPG